MSSQHLIPLSIAFSSCPNDIFLFRALLNKPSDFPLPIRNLTITDINDLNQLVKKNDPLLIKISASFYPCIQDYYRMLPVGAALGESCGPILVKLRKGKEEIQTIAVPGLQTTAASLTKILYPQATFKASRYDTILQSVASKQVDAGTLIHESRFTYDQELFSLVCDLGSLWIEKYNLPIPLGCLVISRSLPVEYDSIITQFLQKSLRDSLSVKTNEAIELALFYAKEKDPSVITEFIRCYVSPETQQLSSRGLKGFQKLWELTAPFQKKEPLCPAF